MLILLTNDDGINAPGLRALYHALSGLGELWVVAPAEERSGVGHAFSIKGPLQVDKVDWGDDGNQYAVDGTPADAVKLAVRSLLPHRPGLVVSGINQGENTGIDLIYSGTVAGAREGAVFGIPAVSLSLCSKTYDDFSVVSIFARKLCEKVIANGLPEGSMLNVNVPPLPSEQIRGIRITHQAVSRYEEVVDRRIGPDGSLCFWVDYNKVVVEDGRGSDVFAVRDGHISVTPLHHRFTDNELVPVLTDWKLADDL